MDAESFPLLTVDSDDRVRRRVGKTRLQHVMCPIGNMLYCSTRCAFIGLVEKDGTRLPGLVCRFHGTSYSPIGLIDMDYIDLEIYETLKAGSELLKQLSTVPE